MRRYAWIVALSAAAAMPAWADAGGQGAKAPAAEKRVVGKSAEVERLQRDVAAQEAKSREADRKMEEQDRAIADLRRQLEQLKGARAGSGNGR